MLHPSDLEGQSLLSLPALEAANVAIELIRRLDTRQAIRLTSAINLTTITNRNGRLGTLVPTLLAVEALTLSVGGSSRTPQPSARETLTMRLEAAGSDAAALALLAGWGTGQTRLTRRSELSDEAIAQACKFPDHLSDTILRGRLTALSTTIRAGIRGTLGVAASSIGGAS